MVRLSAHFTLSELTVTETGLPNEPGTLVVERLKLLAGFLEQVRFCLGGTPIFVTSAYRSIAVNTAVGGTKTSDHLTGNAADIRHSELNPFQVVRELERSQLTWTQLINEQEKGVTHISFDPNDLRRQILTQKGLSYVYGNVRHGSS